MTKKENKAIKLAKIKIQIDIIRNCIQMSKDIMISNAFKLALRNAEFFLARLPYVVPYSDKIKEYHRTINIKSYDLKRFISISLKNLAYGKNIHIQDLFWFSPHDLKNGYILLYPDDNTKYANYVLFLKQTVDTFDATVYWPGDILPYKHINHLLPTMKGLSEKELGIASRFVTKTELLNELSNLKSIIKS